MSCADDGTEGADEYVVMLFLLCVIVTLLHHCCIIIAALLQHDCIIILHCCNIMCMYESPMSQPWRQQQRIVADVNITGHRPPLVLPAAVPRDTLVQQGCLQLRQGSCRRK